MFDKLTYLLTLLVIGFTPLDALEISEGSGVTLGRYFFIGMAILALLTNKIRFSHTPSFIKILALFICWACMTTLWSIDNNITIIRCLYLVQYIIIAITMVNVLNTTNRLRMGMIAWILGSAYIAYKTATDYSQNAIGADGLYRVSSFGNPNENSFMLCYALVFCYLIDKTRLRLPSIIFTAYSVYAVVANGSRMGIILFVVAVAAFCAQLWQSKQRWYVYILIPCIIWGGIYVLNHIPKATLLRILGIMDNIEEGDLAYRQNIWAATFDMLDTNRLWSIVGCGWGTFISAIKTFVGKSIGAHNFYLDLLSTTGIIGLGIVFYYFWRLFLIIKSTYKVTIMNYLMLALPLMSMMSTNWQSRRWWFMMGAFIYLIYKSGNFNCKDGKKRIC